MGYDLDGGSYLPNNICSFEHWLLGDFLIRSLLTLVMCADIGVMRGEIVIVLTALLESLYKK